MLQDRKKIFDNISRVLAITRYDIEQHQLINDLSLNIHGENWFRDVFTFVYKENFVNANFESSNSQSIDLVIEKSQKAYQLTTTRSKDKVINTYKGIKQTKFKSYNLFFFYLLDKSKFSSSSITYFKNSFGVDINDKLLDYTDLIKEIENLETNDLIELNNRYFTNKLTKYTNEMILDLIIRHLVCNKNNSTIDYDDDFGTEDVRIKLKINNINPRISSEINKGLDYQCIITDFIDDNNLIIELRKFVIDTLYKNILLSALNKKVALDRISSKQTSELQDIASELEIDFNKLINKLYIGISNSIDINDFNAMNISWIIIAYFFELCDVGVDSKC